MKKILALLLTAFMVISLSACDTALESRAAYAIPSQSEVLASATNRPVYGTLTYGTATQTNADFMSGWTNVSSNSQIKSLIYGYSVLGYTSGGEYPVDPIVVKSLETLVNEDGSKTFFVEIYENLVWNDGTPITAKDYVFYLLLRSSPEFRALDGTATAGYYYVGYKEFYAGDTKTFTGIRLYDDYSWSVTAAAEHMPYYYDILYADCMPLPMHVIAPGVDVFDNGDGATITDAFTDELLRKTLLDPQDGYRYNPKVTCGPYDFVSFDTASSTAVISINPKFLGDYDGTKPSIERIIVKYTQAATQINELEAGSIDLLSNLGGIIYIEPGLELIERGIVNYHTYDRTGYGLLRIHCDFGPTQFTPVRQAMTYLIDREDFVRQYSGGYAIIVDSMYAKSQYIYQDNKEWLEDNLISYTFNPQKALELLVDDGWTLNENGQPFTPGVDKMRYKMFNGELMPLQINWASSGNVVSELLRVLFIPEAEKVGMIIEETVLESVMNESSRNGIRDEDAYYHFFNMGLGFGIPFSPWNSYQTAEAFWGGNYNNNFLRDEKMNDIVLSMRNTDPLDKEGFDKKWLEFIVYYNEIMPSIPLYSDTYFDLYIPKLKNFNTNSNYGFGSAILSAYLEK